ncbi:MAG: acetyl-CoA C-acetyltransferase [Gammaproteobacteria bacterium]|nr:acetyl-CoA C-acetyltransferase [Gammaproteobacteria bacterium]NIR82554.1 acetyl-CoA C-acetyltransferase [Gammaproteobacteria bacterium]NIR88601.1 acetyl-CoA C-acetyltransferase [Gammaproteobacteria bacterium]NIU03695.1 acetyl-CoA C-acetyltransferase [Gammaproteobacteria bacterium]NIV51030.1 acetyl-CoA C-acetyltransferase [Gammaproteobacteria bacterium]
MATETPQRTRKPRRAPRRSPGAGRRSVYLVDGARTPFLKARGAPGPFSAADLAVQAGRRLLLRQPFDPSALDEVIVGCIIPGPDEANIGRVTALRLGCGEHVPAWTVQRNCGSGLQAVDCAAQAIADGRSELVLAGGTESMSHAPVLWRPEMVALLAAWSRARGPGERVKALARLRPAHLKPIIGLLRGLRDPVVGLSMGQTAEVLSKRFGITREEMDAFAVQSHQRLAKAQEEGRLDEVEPVYHDATVHDVDDGVRPDTSTAALAKLRPAFDPPFGQVTAGNSAQVTDGAAWVLVAGERAVKRYGLEPRARMVDAQWAGLDPAQMGLGPVYASTPLLKRHGLGLDQLDHVEINEAFAAQVLACLAAWRDRAFCRDQLGLRSALGALDPERLNVDGGAIAIGHPVGTSGARLVLHLLHVLAQRGGTRALATLCIGGGQGGAMLIERA